MINLSKVYLKSNIVIFNFISFHFFLISGVFIFMAFISPLIILLSIIIFVPGLTIFRYIAKKKLIKWGYQRQKYEELRIESLQNLSGAYPEIYANDSIDYFINFYNENTVNRSKAESKEFSIRQFPRITLEIISLIVIVL